MNENEGGGMIGQVPDHLLDAAYRALQEGRLHYRCTNAQGRPCNGGDAEPIPLGEWSPEVPDAKICERGWHLTTDPLLWRGARVWICEGEGLVGREGDKTCWRRIRPLAEVDPKTAICWRARVAAMRSDLRGANLQGADLRDANLWLANLWRANLQRAYLRGANLQGANLQGADLWGANLQDAILREVDFRGADLRGACLWRANLWLANLWFANLQRADLRGANLQRADLRGANLQDAGLQNADLQGANLNGANLQDANLAGANLWGADLRNAILGDWERGPDGFARRVEVSRG